MSEATGDNGELILEQSVELQAKSDDHDACDENLEEIQEDIDKTRIPKKQMELSAAGCSCLEGMEGGENDQEKHSGKEEIHCLSMNLIGKSEKELHVKADDKCGHLEGVECAVNNREEPTGKEEILWGSVGKFEKVSGSCGHSRAVDNTVKDTEKMSEEVGKNWDSLGIFEKPRELITVKDGHFEIVEGTVKDLEKIESPLNVVAIAGLYRTGKSYLMNRLAGKTTGFILGSSIESATKGIWAWCQKHPTKESEVLLLLDTEGLGDIKKGSIDQDNKIFTIATLISSTLVYNLMSAFNQDAVEKLTYITMLSKNLKVTSDGSSDESLNCIMPQFVLCLRDFNLELSIDGKEITEDEYLEDCLKTKEVKTPEDEKYNRPRECIKKYFKRRKVFTFDRPAGRSVMRRLDTARDEDLNEDFILETERFMSYVYNAPGKVLNKLLVTGSMLAKLLRVYVNAMNDGSVLCVEDAMMTMSRLENERHTKNAVEEFKGLMNQIQLPAYDKKKLQLSILEYQEQTISKLHSKLLFDTDDKIEEATKAEMQLLYAQLCRRNDAILYDNCIDKLHEMHKKGVRANIDKGKYAVAGGHTIYNTDMRELFEEYNRELKNIDLDERQRAQTEFENKLLPESKRIMDEDKAYSEKEVKESITQQLEIAKQDLAKTHEREKMNLKMELDNQRKEYEDEMKTIRKNERERHKRKIKQLREDVRESRNRRDRFEAWRLEEQHCRASQTRLEQQKSNEKRCILS